MNIQHRMPRAEGGRRVRLPYFGGETAEILNFRHCHIKEVSCYDVKKSGKFEYTAGHEM